MNYDGSEFDDEPTRSSAQPSPASVTRTKIDDWIFIDGHHKLIASIGFLVGIPSLTIWGGSFYHNSKNSEPVFFWITACGVSCILFSWVRNLAKCL